MNEKLCNILEQSSSVFMRLGVRSLTMDDVAKHLRISKKTLYQFVSDKSDLVMKCINRTCAMDEQSMVKILEKNQNAIDEILEISQFVLARLSNVHPSIFFDLEKYHPEAMSKFEEHKSTFIAGTISRNLEKGIKEGLYRSDLNIEVISKLYLNSIDQALHGNLFTGSTFSLSQIYIEIFRYHVRGIASEKGLVYLIEKVKREKLVG